MELVLKQTSSKFLCENEPNQKFWKSKKLVLRFHQRFHKNKKQKKKRVKSETKGSFWNQEPNNNSLYSVGLFYFYFYNLWCSLDGDHPQANLAKTILLKKFNYF
jgi:hypothetical protein